MGETRDEGLLAAMAAAANVDKDAYFAALMRVCGCKDSTKADFIVLLKLANDYKLDPLRKEIALIDTKRGPKVYIGIDGWLRIMTSNPDYLAHDVEVVWSGGAPGKGTPDAATLVLHTRKRKAEGLPPFRWTEYLRECNVTGDYTPWRTHPARMLCEKAMIHGVRFCWNVYIPDMDEYDKMDSEMVRAGVASADGAPTNLTPAIVMPAARTAATAAPKPEVIDVPAERVVDFTNPTPSRQEPAAVPQREFDHKASLEADKKLAEAEKAGAFDDLDL